MDSPALTNLTSTGGYGEGRERGGNLGSLIPSQLIAKNNLEVSEAICREISTRTKRQGILKREQLSEGILLKIQENRGKQKPSSKMSGKEKAFDKGRWRPLLMCTWLHVFAGYLSECSSPV